MESLFTNTRVELTKEFTESCSMVHVDARLNRVKAITGVYYTKAQDKIVLTGSWKQVNDAYTLLSDWVKGENDVAPTNTANTGTNGNKYNSITSQMEKKAWNGVNDCPNKLNKDEKRGKGNGKEKNTQVMKDKPSTKCQKKGTDLTDSRSASAEKFGERIQEASDEINTDNKINDKMTHRNMKLRSFQSDQGNQQDLTRISETDVTDREGKDDDTERRGFSSTKYKRKPGEKGYWSRVKIENYNEKHTCSKCGVTLKSRKRYMEHMRRIHIKEFECKVCFRRFGYPTDLNRHKCPGFPDHDYSSKSKGGRPKKEKKYESISCEDCDYVGTSKKKMNDHVKRTHKLELSCDMCDKKFGFTRDLHRHKSSVHSETYYYCDRCSRKYKSKESLQIHLKTHEEGYIPSIYPCEVCGKIFSRRYCLNTHHKMEHLGNDGEYLCQKCGKKFRQRNSYKQHMNAHNRVTPYTCDVCGKSFTYQKSLKEHKFMHDDVRRFKCNICTKSFRQRTTLHIHLKVHKSIKDHICSQCGKGFSQKQALDRHERTHTGVKPYTCITCQRKFGDASTIRRHMKAIHHKTDFNWREDISCNLRKTNDYYVLGGTGHNRCYKSKLGNENHTFNSIINTSKPSHANAGAVATKASQSVEKVIIVVPSNELNTDSSVHKSGYTTYTELNNLQTTIQTSDNLQSSPSDSYCIATAQQSENSTPINRTYNQGDGHVLTYYSLPQSGDELFFPIRFKQENDQEKPRQLQTQSQYIDLQTTSLQTPSNSEEVAVGIEPLRTTYQIQAPEETNPETSMNQTLGSLWGMMGYPNVTHYQGGYTQ